MSDSFSTNDAPSTVQGGGDGMHSPAYDVLGSFYAVLGVVAFVQLLRIHARQKGVLITTQKAFVALNFCVLLLRSCVFFCRNKLNDLDPVAVSILLDLPGVLFFTTYSLLIWFWAQIYEQIHSSGRSLRFQFFAVNVFVLVTSSMCWTGLALSEKRDGNKAAMNAWKIAAVSVRLFAFLAATFGFATYGGLLYFMLRKFPDEATGKSRKLFEVGVISVSCCACFTFRSVCILIATIVPRQFPLDVLTSPTSKLNVSYLNVVYYFVSEISPTAMCLYALRKLPAKRDEKKHSLRRNLDEEIDDVSDGDDYTQEEKLLQSDEADEADTIDDEKAV